MLMYLKTTSELNTGLPPRAPPLYETSVYDIADQLVFNFIILNLTLIILLIVILIQLSLVYQIIIKIIFFGRLNLCIDSEREGLNIRGIIHITCLLSRSPFIQNI